MNTKKSVSEKLKIVSPLNKSKKNIDLMTTLVNSKVYLGDKKFV